MNEAILSFLAGLCIGLTLAFCLTNDIGRNAVKNGYIQLDGKFYRIEQLPGNAPHE